MNIPDKEKEHLFDNPQNLKRLLRVFYVFCVLLLGLDLVIHRHVSHPAEALFGFYAWFGFAACVALVIVAKWMRIFLIRNEHYYED
ncbi:MAG: hypothetical protein U9Q71_08805 [Pseudomonadota bacterium]|nr:hypothetical protein [Pseudomonadota bacterium]